MAKKTIKIGLYGGSFDPPHLAHQILALSAVANLQLDFLLVLPSVNPYQKEDNQLISSYTLRMFLCRQAFSYSSLKNLQENELFIEYNNNSSYDLISEQYIDKIIVSDLENLLSCKYSFDLMLKLNSDEGKKILFSNISEDLSDYDIIFYLVCGEDQYYNFSTWYNAFLIPAYAKLAFVKRHCDNIDKNSVVAEKSRILLQNNHVFFDCAYLNISSSRLRERLIEFSSSSGMILSNPEPEAFFFVIDNVYDYLKKYISKEVLFYIFSTRLYFLQENLKLLSLEQRQKIKEYDSLIYNIEGEKRALHSNHVMLYAVHYALKFKLNIFDMAMAAILHDIAKTFSKEKCYEILPELREDRIENYKLWHGPVGAEYIKQKFLTEKDIVIKAVKYHTSMCMAADTFIKVLFLADKLEFSRKYDDIDDIRELLESNRPADSRLNLACISCIEKIQVVLKKMGLTPDENLLQALASLKSSDFT